jgi:hypothetical protein
MRYKNYTIKQASKSIEIGLKCIIGSLFKSIFFNFNYYCIVNVWVIIMVFYSNTIILKLKIKKYTIKNLFNKNI